MRGFTIERIKLIYRVTVAACMAAFFVGAPSVSARLNHMSRPERVAMHHCQRGIVRSCIHRAAIHRHVPFQTMLNIAYRESRLNPFAKNPSSTASGLFQFLTSTWATTPYAGRDIFSAKWNALAAAWEMRSYGYSAWAATCC